MRDYILGAALIMLIIGAVFFGTTMMTKTNPDHRCKAAYFQMQAVLRCMDNYPMCTTTAQDFEDSRWNVDYYDRNCYDYEQRRPKPVEQKKSEKPKLDS